MKLRWLVPFLFPVTVWAACSGSSPNWTTTPDQSSFTSCWNHAVARSTPQTITVSAGTATWSSRWSGNAATNSVTIQGATTVKFSGTAGQSGYSATWGDNAGACSSVGTCITGAVETVFEPAVSNSALVRITGITFISTDSGSSHGIIGCQGTHTQQNCRIDHNHFYMEPLSLTMFVYSGNGLVDHNEFDDTGSGGGGPMAVGGDLDSAGYLNWQDPTNLGSADGWVIEQNIINFSGATDGAVDSYYGAKVTFRFNNVTGTTNALSNGIGWNHGTDSGALRSTVSDEIYGNYFANNTGAGTEIGNSRGGTMLYWGNTHAGNAPWTSLVLQYFRCLGQDHSSAWGSVCTHASPGVDLGLNWTPVSNVTSSVNAGFTTLNANDWRASHSYEAGAYIGPTSKNAGNYNYQNRGACTSSGTRPSFSQTFPFGTTSDGSCTWMNVGGSTAASPSPGTAAGFLSTAPDTTCDSGATCTVYFDTKVAGCYYRDQPGCDHNQVLAPNYEWENTGAQVPSTVFSTDPQTANMIVQNQHYYDYQTSGCSGTQTTGVCSGALASAAPTCTAGVGYWATDQGSWNTSGNGFSNGVLYVCGSDNTWSVYYTPYTYPDPLEGGAIRPAPPTSLKLTVSH